MVFLLAGFAAGLDLRSLLSVKISEHD